MKTTEELKPILVFLLTVPGRFFCRSSSLCVDDFICGVCFVMICFSAVLVLVHRKAVQSNNGIF